VTTLREVESALDAYSLEDILELNEMTEADALYLLVNECNVELPDPAPVDLDD
jgi:hypothetical protein